MSALVDMFRRRLANAPGLSCFHAAVPAVSMAWLDARLLARERLSHGRRPAASPELPGVSEAAAFMDDGFAFGLAFLLQVCYSALLLGAVSDVLQLGGST